MNARLAIAAIALLAASCGLGRPSFAGTLPKRDGLYDYAHRTVAAWQADASLPSIATRLCDSYRRGVTIHRLTAQEFRHQVGLHPLLEDGTCGQAEACASGSWSMTGVRNRRIPHIYLSPGETAEGHGWTVAHEMAHALAHCSAMSMDDWIGHADARLWRAGGVVHRAMGR